MVFVLKRNGEPVMSAQADVSAGGPRFFRAAVHRRELLPLVMRQAGNGSMAHELGRWLQDRCIPPGRAGIAADLRALIPGLPGGARAGAGRILVTAALLSGARSMNDGYALLPEDGDLVIGAGVPALEGRCLPRGMSFEKRAAFSQDFHDAAFAGLAQDGPCDFNSPDWCTGGTRRKAWLRTPRGPLLEQECPASLAEAMRKRLAEARGRHPSLFAEAQISDGPGGVLRWRTPPLAGEGECLVTLRDVCIAGGSGRLSLRAAEKALLEWGQDAGVIRRVAPIAKRLFTEDAGMRKEDVFLHAGLVLDEDSEQVVRAAMWM